MIGEKENKRSKKEKRNMNVKWSARDKEKEYVKRELAEWNVIYLCWLCKNMKGWILLVSACTHKSDWGGKLSARGDNNDYVKYELAKW